MPICWETHSVPLLGEEDRRAQGVINEQVLKHADLLVAVFESRIGTNTGREISGTIEEINLHQRAGKPVQIYFGLETAGEQDQIDQVLAYKEQCKTTGLIGEYRDCDHLKFQFQDHLPQLINSHGYFAKKMSVITKTDSKQRLGFNEKCKMLMLEAANDIKGHITISQYLGEHSFVITNGTRFFDFKDELLEMVREGYVREEDGERRIYKITDLGFQKIGELQAQEL
jgi:hypothetical protein